MPVTADAHCCTMFSEHEYSHTHTTQWSVKAVIQSGDNTRSYVLGVTYSTFIMAVQSSKLQTGVAMLNTGFLLWDRTLYVGDHVVRMTCL